MGGLEWSGQQDPSLFLVFGRAPPQRKLFAAPFAFARGTRASANSCRSRASFQFFLRLRWRSWGTSLSDASSGRERRRTWPPDNAALPNYALLNRVANRVPHNNRLSRPAMLD